MEKPTILVIRLSAIGDVVMATPVAEGLRRRYPDATIHWLAEPAVLPVLENNPFVDRVIVWQKARLKADLRGGRFIRAFRSLRDLRDTLRRNRYTMALDLQGLLKSGSMARLSGAPVRVGLGSKEGSGIFMTRTVDRPPDDPMIGSEYLMLLESLGCDTTGLSMTLAVSDRERSDASALLRKWGVTADYAVFAPLTTRPQKHWREERWPDVARLIRREMGIRTVILGGPGDQDAAERIRAAEPDVMVNGAGHTTLRQAFALIAGSACFVGVDTGLTHAAVALGVPTTAIFGATRPYQETGSGNTTVLYHPRECSPCRRDPTCGGAFDCMAAVTADEVMRSVEKTVNEGRTGS